MFVAMALGGGGGFQTSLAGTKFQHSRFRTDLDCYAGVYLKNDGVEWAWSNSGVWEGGNLGNWLDVGTAAELWVRCTLNSGTLDASNAGVDTWLTLSVNRNWAIVDTTLTGGPDTANFVLEIATDAAGSNIIDTKTYALQANKETGA